VHFINYLGAFKYCQFKLGAIAVSLAMPKFQPTQSWFIKYKIYHIPFWMVYSYLLWALTIGSLYEAARELYFSVLWVKGFLYMIFPAFAVYFNLYFLIPRYLQKGRYIWYILFLALTIVASSYLILSGYYLSAWLAGKTAKNMWGITFSFNSFFQVVKNEPLRSTLAAITLGMSIKLTKNWIETQRRQRELEKEKLETELKFLKYQFNPHFLFNSINSIFFLIHKNPDMASDSLAKFSELLRHQLYECNDELIPLTKEISYLENFIELEKLRQSPDLVVSFNVDGDFPEHLGVAPFILMTFVENAFKHVSRGKGEPNSISIALNVNGQHLDFNVSNTTSHEQLHEIVKYSGIGLKNVQRRLDLVYPNQYTLRIDDNAESFEVWCNLELSPIMVNNAPQIMA
jgi:sensor histidine kinase YesM